MSRHASERCECGHCEAPAASPGRGRSGWATLAPVLACLVCPACLSTWAKLLAFAGVGLALSEGQHLVLLLAACAVALVFTVRATLRGGSRWALAGTAAGVVLLMVAHVSGDAAPLEWVGMALLVLSGFADRVLQAVRPRAKAAEGATAGGQPRLDVSR